MSKEGYSLEDGTQVHHHSNGRAEGKTLKTSAKTAIP